MNVTLPRVSAMLVVACCCLTATALACSVPVFRFALEQWRPDAYQVFVYHDEDLSPEQRRWLAPLQHAEQLHAAEAVDAAGVSGSEGGANVVVRTIDLRQQLEPADRHRWESLGAPALPHVSVHLPRGIGGGEVPVGSAPLTQATVDSLLASPARTELARRLIAGQVVWVFLTGGDSSQDDAQLAVLETELAALQQSLKLPEIAPEDLKELSVAPEALEIRFSALRVDRNDPAEKWLVEMLLSTEPDLRDEDLAGEPLAFPIFGRGRALYALVGLGINAEMLKEAAEFLTGPCQCTVKADNPGVDLLLPVRWDQHIVPSAPEEVEVPLVGLAGYAIEPQDDDEAAIAVQTAGMRTLAGLGPGEAAAAGGEQPAPVLAASLWGQIDTPVQRPASTGWLPWVVMLALAIAVTLASLRFFWRP